MGRTLRGRGPGVDPRCLGRAWCRAPALRRNCDYTGGLTPRPQVHHYTHHPMSVCLSGKRYPFPPPSALEGTSHRVDLSRPLTSMSFEAQLYTNTSSRLVLICSRCKWTLPGKAVKRVWGISFQGSYCASDRNGDSLGANHVSTLVSANTCDHRTTGLTSPRDPI